MRLFMSKSFFVSCLAILITTFAFIHGHSAHAGQKMTLQIHPYLPASELLTRFAPLTRYLSRITGTEINCNISKNYEEHIEKVGKNMVDIAYLGPASYVKLVSKYGTKPILARLEVKGSPFFKGVIITSKSSKILSLDDLKGKRFAFGDPHSTMSYLVPLYMLREKGVSYESLERHEFLNSHKNVVLGVLMGDFDAGAVKEEVYYQYRDRGLRDVAWTPEVSEHLFVARSTLPQESIEALRKALLGIQRKDVILSSIKQDVTAMVPARDEDYDNLRSILLTLPQQLER
ncbi:MAG: phosphate/phosphite/phosphonate ABC transporter substrate-binding protein [Nitrospiraceae bacterium]|nr:MAG: phosphate/phosphite/phosphonate ABC transporter substrate-binding protein [Nitrospiraceae bacterium]